MPIGPACWRMAVSRYLGPDTEAMMQMQINRKRLEESMAALGRIGETPAGGLSRLALTDEDRRGRDLLVEWMRAAGLTVTI
ncbi:MAG TPA: hypothetical protein VIJ73_17885, partial [Methylomirabilota bacterium]